MRLLTAGPPAVDGHDVVDGATALATFWRDVTRKVQLNYPELSEDDLRDQIFELLLDVHAAACRRSAGARTCASETQALSLLRAACADVVDRSAGGASSSDRAILGDGLCARNGGAAGLRVARRGRPYPSGSAGDGGHPAPLPASRRRR